MRSSHPRDTPLVKAAAIVFVVAAAAAGVWAGSVGRPPRPAPAFFAYDDSFLRAGDTVTAEPDAGHGAMLFQQRCARCHTIGGGRRVGPDLATVAFQRDPAWVRAMVAAPDSMFRTDSVARWVLDVHDIDPEDVAAGNDDLRALAAFLASLDPAR